VVTAAVEGVLGASGDALPQATSRKAKDENGVRMVGLLVCF
jgi:hypothetical protein